MERDTQGIYELGLVMQCYTRQRYAASIYLSMQTSLCPVSLSAMQSDAYLLAPATRRHHTSTPVPSILPPMICQKRR